jgi:DNA polymerase
VSVLEQFEALFGDAGKPLSQLIRPAIAAPKGRTLVWGDWSAIEARVLPWLADSSGSREVLQVFRDSDADPTAPDIYIREAAGIDGHDMRELWAAYQAGDVAANESRQGGKVAVLSLGFGGARGALQAMAANYGLYLSDAEADRIVRRWRDNNPWARRFWDELWDAFQNAMESPGTVYAAGRVAFTYDPGYMRTVFMTLPDGRPLAYPGVRWGEREVENERGEIEVKKGLVYRRGDEVRGLWYGTLAENATQASAGSRLREALEVLAPAPQLDDVGREVSSWYPLTVVGHTHDEIVGECDEEDLVAAGDILGAEMMRVPGWMEGCPMAAELSSHWYYTKAKGVAQSWKPR